MPSSRFHRLQRLQALARNTLFIARDRAARALLAPAVALICTPALAALPTLPKPGEAIGGGTVAEGDWLGNMGALMKAGLIILGLIIVGYGFIHVVAGSIAKWRAYTAGKAEKADLVEYFIMAGVLGGFMVIMVTYALETIK
ncbi:DUF2976 domain-containing protein [Paracidovorax valerianellae]|uniref:Integrating conjugative element membrane protein, PFL_4702 family n=1 Tax=Paracidovorax valerianellae TaxID=187868 RepID=A0A1G7EIH5_9BURK|nr:DUF2976 domain-containing protein [Paracidovorax valerianellae]MDA8446371.1 DUF2976 domain-containing protein [Paracidovorax valerianellae]SDE63464.1 Protein of unknown function [Paracidovorax valerianellae]